MVSAGCVCSVCFLLGLCLVYQRDYFYREFELVFCDTGKNKIGNYAEYSPRGCILWITPRNFVLCSILPPTKSNAVFLGEQTPKIGNIFHALSMFDRVMHYDSPRAQARNTMLGEDRLEIESRSSTKRLTGSKGQICRVTVC
jgi:hypothetical protein